MDTLPKPLHASRYWSLLTGVFLASATILTCQADEARVKELLPYLPESANVVAVVRMDEILASPRSHQEDWKSKQADRFLAGASSLPPGVETLILGMQFRPQTAELVSSVGLVTLGPGVTLQDISDREGGVPYDTIGGRSSVQSRHNAFYIALTDNILAIVSPASRQEASRYVRQITNKQQLPPPANYLIESASAKHHVLIAMDLMDMANPALLKQELTELPGVDGDTTKLDELLAILLDIRGVRFTADVEDQTQATLSVDFGKEPSQTALLLHPLVRRIISDAGLHISELEGSQAAIKGNSLVLRIGQLSDESLRTVLSLINPEAPLPEVAAMAPPSTTTSSASDSAAEPDPLASKRYLRIINQSLEDLEKANRRLQQPSQNATWHENIARKIEKLSTRGVAPELISYGKSISQKLHGLSASLRGVAIEVDVTQGTLVWNSSYDPGATYASIWGGYGYQAPSYHWDSNLKQVRQMQAEAVIRGEKDRQKAWEVVHEERDKATAWTEKNFGRISP